MSYEYSGVIVKLKLYADIYLGNTIHIFGEHTSSELLRMLIFYSQTFHVSIFPVSIYGSTLHKAVSYTLLLDCIILLIHLYYLQFEIH